MQLLQAQSANTLYGDGTSGSDVPAHRTVLCIWYARGFHCIACHASIARTCVVTPIRKRRGHTVLVTGERIAPAVDSARGADGLPPILRLEGQLLRRHARPGPRCRGVLYREEGRRRALAKGMVAEVFALLLMAAVNEQTNTPGRERRVNDRSLPGAVCL